MFKPIKYNVVFKDGEEIKTFPVSKLVFNQLGVSQAFFKPNPTEEAELFVEVDHETVFLQEFTAKYDKVGQEILSGDILKKSVIRKEVEFPCEANEREQLIYLEENIGVILRKDSNKGVWIVAPYAKSIDPAFFEEVNYMVAFFDGAFLAISEIREESFPLTEEFCRTVTKVGSVYSTPELIQKEIDESVFAQNNEEENK